MGTFNEILVPCPMCGNRVVFQSKSGSCALITFSINKVPMQDLKGIKGDMETCDECGYVVEISNREEDIVDGSSLVR